MGRLGRDSAVMTFDERLAAIRERINGAGLDWLVAVHDGAHFIEKPDPVLVLSGFKALGPSAALMRRDGALVLVMTPAWDEARAARTCPGYQVIATDDVMAGIERALRDAAPQAAIGLAGLPFLPVALAKPLTALLPNAQAADDVVFEPASSKTDAEIAHAREATRIAEVGFQRLLELARPGISEDELAVELRCHSKALGADDNFLLMCASPHNKAVAPSCGRRLQKGDILVVELTPSYRGQLAQICRTVVLGSASDLLREKYALVVTAMQAGFAAAQPGAVMADVCGAINTVLEAEGYGEYCHPPHIRRRGHGLGFGSIRPGDVALDNDTVLEPGMLFMIHPNQYLPETGYLLCGEPALMTGNGAMPLTLEQAKLAEIAL